MLDPLKESGRVVRFHVTKEPISPSWLLFRKRRMGEAFILEGSADGQAFEISIEQILAPRLQAGQIVVMDNLSTHTREKVRQASRAHGDADSCFCHPPPPTCRRLRKPNPALKAFVRRVGARTPETLQEAIGQALLTITPHDALGWFTHCGYQWSEQGNVA